LGQKISTKGTRAESGTGIGLVMVKEFIDRHNGTIEVESSVGQGTTFKIVIPQV
jgi:signal transduction histidine kinase